MITAFRSTWEERRAIQLEKLRAERERQLEAVERRLRWSAPSGLSAGDLLARVTGTAWTPGATLDAMHGALRELAEAGRVHQRDECWYHGPAPRLPKPDGPQRVEAHAGPEAPCSPPDTGHDARPEGALAGAATGDEGADVPEAQLPPVQADELAVAATESGTTEPAAEPFPSEASVLETVSESIRRRRETLGLSQRQLAELAGITQSNVSRVERGLARGDKTEAVVRVLEDQEAVRRTGGCPPPPDPPPPASDDEATTERHLLRAALTRIAGLCGAKAPAGAMQEVRAQLAEARADLAELQFDEGDEPEPEMVNPESITRLSTRLVVPVERPSPAPIVADLLADLAQWVPERERSLVRIVARHIGVPLPQPDVPPPLDL